MLRALVVALAVVIGSSANADVTVVEYYHSGFAHYFITPIPGEIAKLDAHAAPFELWSRTGRTFRGYDSSGVRAGSVDICRFFNESFAPKSSHFYAPHGLGCEDTMARFADWKLEDDKLFAAMLPDANGACPAGTVPVYRLYNMGQGGAPNHRFVTSAADRQAMLDAGWIAEGNGSGVGMCVPSISRTTPEGFWRGTSNQGHRLQILILADGRYFIFYSKVGNDADAGAVLGSASWSGGALQTADGRDVAFYVGSGLAGDPAAISGSYVPAASLNLQFGIASVAASYDPEYDEPADLAQLAGNYAGVDGHRNDPHPATVSIDARGNLTLYGEEATFTAIAAPRAESSVLEVTLTNYFPGTKGILFYDRAGRRLVMVVPIAQDDALLLFAARQ